MWRFKPIFKPTLWGGGKILYFKGWAANDTLIGESWELSGVDGMESVVSSPRDYGMSISALIEKYGADLLGEKNYEKFGSRFPLLVKFIDATKPLSIQVHPDDETAAAMGIGRGKSEMWYVLSADEGSNLYFGFNRTLTADEFRGLLDDDNITAALNDTEVNAGDAFFIPSGRIHGVGGGVFLVEIQQASDNTFRIYDYHRTDVSGRERELRIADAEKVADFSDVNPGKLEYMEIPHVPSVIIDTPSFTSKLLRLQSQMRRHYGEVDSFVIMICVEGTARLETRNHEMDISQGETVLLSALEKDVMITPSGDFSAIEVFIR